MVQRIDDTSIEWRGNAPVSSRFDDIYYSEDNGLEESEFIFLKGIGAPECWHNTDEFVIAETGFGTGLNFLATYRAWLESGAKGTLTYISVEKYPLSAAALEKAHQTFPALSAFSKELCEAWPPPSPGFHLRSFEGGKIQLLLLFGDAAESFSDLHAKVDAWFLDGFSPAKNPDMWTDELFGQIARLSKPGTCFATFTAAGRIARALEEHGFDTRKTPGYGRKLERLQGHFCVNTRPSPKQTQIPEWASVPQNRKTSSTIILGAGIAGASLARNLQDQGQKVLLVSNGFPAGSQVPAAILSPGFQRSNQPSAIFAEMCFAHACANPSYKNAWAENRGVLLTSEDPEEQSRLHAIADKLDWDSDWLVKTLKGISLPKSGALSPTRALANTKTNIDTLIGDVSAVVPTSSGWQVTVGDTQYTADNLVVAAAMNSGDFLGLNNHIDLRAKPGQIEVVNDCSRHLPSGTHSYGGYVTATTHDHQGNRIRTIGSTFAVKPDDDQKWPAPSTKNSTENLDKLKQVSGDAPILKDIQSSWAGMRATTPDYMPYVGPIPDWQKATEQFQLLSKDKKIRGLGDMPYQQGLYLLTGFGAKGFQQAPLCAAYIAALICGNPLPIPLPLIPYLHPARHMIKSIVRRNKG